MMKTIKPLVLTVLVVGAIAFPVCAQEGVAVTEKAPAEKTKWTLADVKKMVIVQNPSLQAAAQRVTAAAAAVKQARSAYYPRIDLLADARHVENAPSRGAFPIPDPYDSTSAGIGISWVLFDGFQRKFSILGASYGHEISQEAYRDGQRLLLQAVSLTFYQALLARELMEISREDAAFNQILLVDAKKRLDAGVAGRSEVLNFDVRSQTAEVQFINAEKNWRIACVALGELLAVKNLDISGSVDLVPIPLSESGTRPVLENELAYALVNRPDIRRAGREIARANAQSSQAESTFLPTVSLYGNYGWSRNDSVRYNRHSDQDAYVGISAKWNLFAGGGDRQRIIASKASAMAATKEREQMMLNVESELRQAFLTMDASQRQMSLQERIHALSLQIRELVSKEYKAGTATITRLNETQTDLVKASSSLSLARIRYLQSLEDIAAASSRILDGTR